MSIRHIINSVIILIARVGLVNGIISEMNVKILQITRIGQLIFFSRKANQSLVIEINSQGVARSHQHVDSHIEFQTLIEQRISDVLLNHTPFFFLKISRILSQINASALTSGLRFNDKRLYQTPLPRFNVIVPYFTVIIGVQEGTGIEIIVLREVLLHGWKSSSEVIFAGDDAHVGEMIDFLLIGHLLENFVGDSSVAPLYIPVFGLGKVFEFPVESVLPANLQ